MSVEVSTTLIGAVLVIGLALFGFSESGTDYTETVANNEKLARVFESKDVSNPNRFQALLIDLCNDVHSCGTE